MREFMPAIGARPVGASDEAGAAQAVQQMFDSIAPRYDLLNHVLSANVDRLWWRKTARSFRPILAADFARGMLSRGAAKFGAPEGHKPDQASHEPARPYAVPIEADALHLPFPAKSLDLIVTAFGFRNLVNYEAGLKEFYRVLKPGAQLGILEFSEPGGFIGRGYALYFRHILPAIGRMICGKDGPYNYLPTSVGKFPPPDQMLQLMRSAGYVNSTWQPYTFGIAGLYTAMRLFSLEGP
jgi:demethylmenaquinone methyltransferase/2-methoxy-6-polyprenyl-1,4-benzoquinol methylase